MGITPGRVSRQLCGYLRGDTCRGDAVEVEAPIVEVVLEYGVPPWGSTISA